MEDLFKIFENFSDGVIIIDENGKILFWNKYFEELSGISTAEAEGENVWEIQARLMPEFYSDKEENERRWTSGEIKKIASEKERQISEIKFLKNDGSPVFIEQHFHSFFKNGKTYFYVFIRDITERKENEEMIKRAINIMHHDLRSPLNAMIGFSAPDLVSEASIDELRMYMSLIQESSGRMLRMIEFYLMFSRLKKGENNIQKKQTSLFTFLDKVRNEFAYFGKAHGVELKVVFDHKKLTGASTFEINIERAIFQPVLMNLLRNAAEATPSSEKKDVSLIVSWNHDKIFFTVYNNGEVPIEVRDKLFQENATFGKKGGSGLGLYSAKLGAEAHGGSITYKPEEGGNKLYRKYSSLIREQRPKQ